MKNPMMILGLLTLSLATGCATNRVRDVDNEILVKGTTSSGALGLHDNVAVIQKETRADDELRVIEWRNNQMEEKLASEYFEFKRCRNDLADPRLAGSGQVIDLPSIDDMKQASEIKEQFGLNQNKDLVFVTREDFLKRVSNERAYSGTLTQMLKTVGAGREECERRMGYARIKAGLPSQRIQGRAKLNASGTIDQVVQKHENNLDDAFAMSSSEQEE